MDGGSTETMKIPMGYNYKYTQKTNDDGTIAKEKTPYFPYTKTSAITNKDNVNLDVILEELRHFTGYPLTTDITWSEPGRYALDASVGAQYYNLCQEVFQSADSALNNLVAAIGISRNDGDNFSSVLAEMKRILNNIRKEIITRGGTCPADPTLTQVYEAVKALQKNTVTYVPFSGEICMSYNEFAKFPNCGVNKKYSGGKFKGYYNNWKHLGLTIEFIDTHITYDKGLFDALTGSNSISKVNVESDYHDYSKGSYYGTEVTYGVEKHYCGYYGGGSILLENFCDENVLYSDSGDLCNPCIRYKKTVNDDTEKVSTTLYDTLATSGQTSYGNKIKFEHCTSETLYANMSQLMCNFNVDADDLYRQFHTNCSNNQLIGDDTILCAFSFPTSWHTSCYNAEVNYWKYNVESPLTTAEKTQWKAEPNIYFYISGYTRRD